MNYFYGYSSIQVFKFFSCEDGSTLYPKALNKILSLSSNM